VPYVPPAPQFDLQAILESSKAALGYELHGYWVFMAQEGADRMIEHNFDSFFALAWPADPELWKTDMAPLGGLKAWLLANRKGPLPAYLTEEVCLSSYSLDPTLTLV
jgi:soluble epoxide hydrolase / lipid-phosphate phosphatase